MPGPERRLQPATVALPERLVAQRRFDKASRTFDAACAVHDHARAVLLNRLDWFDLDPRFVLDAGCATGRAATALRQRYPRARIVGIDRSSHMIAVARSTGAADIWLRGDVETLPCASHSIDLVFANLTLPWCDPQRLLGECARVLTPRGMLLLATTGPGTLQELRRAWRVVDDCVHVHASADLQTLGDLVVQSGLREPVLDRDSVGLRYSAIGRLHEELRAVGATCAAGGRRRTLTGKARFAAYAAQLGGICGSAGAIEVSVELLFVQAWGAQERRPGGDAPSSFRGIPVRSG